MLSDFRYVRRTRNRPVHAIDDSSFNPAYLEAHREPISSPMRAVRMVRSILENHPAAQGYEVPSVLRGLHNLDKIVPAAFQVSMSLDFCVPISRSKFHRA